MHPMTQPSIPAAALTVRQPWADAIAHGTKRIENRSWKLPDKHLGNRILIHAAATPDTKAALSADCGIGRAFGVIPIAQRSAIIAVATLADCHPGIGCCQPWGMPDYYHWELENVVALAVPVPAKGRRGLWTPTSEQISAVTQALEPAPTP